MHLKHLFKSSTRGLLLAGAVCIPGLLFAGNIRQYQFKKGGPEYKALTDAEEIIYPSDWPTQCLLYPAEEAAVMPTVKSGFPIGFDFRFGGQVFDEFVPSTTGYILLGHDAVEFTGYAGNAFNGLYQYAVGNFYLGMHPTMHGVVGVPSIRGTISYKTEGEEGNQVCTVQFNNLLIDENNGTNYGNCGKFSLQIRLYEADGHVEYAFKEEDTIYFSRIGFYCGIHGWDNSDSMLITATGLDNKASISPKRTGNMLEPDTYISWNKDDPDQHYTPVFTFRPAEDAPAPASAPGVINITQRENDLIVTGSKASDAAATMVLISDSPITDMPEDGVTYPAIFDEDAGGIYTSMIGNARVAYYDDIDNFQFVVPEVAPGESLYVKAFSVNGNPKYNTTNTSDASFVAAQEPPAWIRAELVEGGDGKTVEVSWNSKYPVILAVTDERGRYDDYAGKFGLPQPNASVGQNIEGGGKIIYTGSSNSMTYKLETPNRPTYFRIWSVDNNRTSATGTDALALPDATYPYEPMVEYWTIVAPLVGWGYDDVDYAFFPAQRDYDNLAVIRGYSPENDVNRLSTPALPATTGAKLSFNWGLETKRDPQEVDGGILLPKGHEAGFFGDTRDEELADGLGVYFYIDNPDGSRKFLHRITEYTGQMVEFSPDNYCDESATMLPFELELGDIPAGATVTLEFAAVRSTRMFINDFKIVTEDVELPADPTDLTGEYDSENGVININVTKGENAAGTLVLLSEEAFKGSLVNGTVYEAGDEIGNASVVYFGDNASVEASYVNVEEGKTYTVTAVSYDDDYNFNPTFVTIEIEVSGVETIEAALNDISNAVIYNVTGLRLHVNALEELPAGIYIINGKKLIIR